MKRVKTFSAVSTADSTVGLGCVQKPSTWTGTAYGAVRTVRKGLALMSADIHLMLYSHGSASQAPPGEPSPFVRPTPLLISGSVAGRSVAPVTVRNASFVPA